MPPIKVLIVDAAEQNRHGLRAILKSATGIEVIGDTADGSDAVVQARSHQPDVVLMDAAIAESDDDDSCGRIRVVAPGAKLLFLLTYAVELDAGLRTRADAYWFKDGDRRALVRAIRSLAPQTTES